MKEIAVIEELRAVRKRLANEQELDVHRYAAMLREVGKASPAEYVSEPFLPRIEPALDGREKNGG
jgi:hypothetical protein